MLHHKCENSLRFTREKCKNVHVPSSLSASLLRSPLCCAEVYLSLCPVAFAVVTTSLRHYCTWIFQTNKGKSVKYKCKQKRYSIQLLVVASLGSRQTSVPKKGHETGTWDGDQNSANAKHVLIVANTFREHHGLKIHVQISSFLKI